MTGRDLSSWDDLLDPKFKGKLIMQEVSAGRFTAAPWAAYSLVQAFLMLIAISLFRRWAGTGEIEG